MTELSFTDLANTIPFCAPADPAPKAPRFVMPPGAVDCHAHVFGPAEHYAYTSERTYTPPDASLKAYQQLHQTLGIERGVLVQPSVYGLDNSATRDALRALRQKGRDYRGVAVVSSEVSEKQLDALHQDGFRGIRLNLLFKGGLQWKDVVALSERLAARRWHLQFLIDVSDVDELEQRIKRLPTHCVIDHMGHMEAGKGVEHPKFQTLCRLLADGHAWVKLSGAYRTTGRQHLPYEDITPFAQALINSNAERCVWGSDWPHPHISVPMPNDGPLLDELANWAPDKHVRQRILVDNPEALYFADS
ncbi:amidohydrolase family protein [Halomonas sp. TBZ9]|uniref:Amidohydrolase family protein n=2 Tax=Vreelandella azerica TaxID=2732867 RepID=A0A7Y3TW88_9GAMM|nr:amidohydrolase family protein [Halomonas azerica]